LILIDACRRLIRVIILFCSHPSPSVLIPSLRTVGNIVTKMISLAISDICTNGIRFRFNFLWSVITADFIGPLIHLLQNSEYFVAQGCIKPLCDLLIYPDARIVTVCLDGLENILKVGEAEKTMGNTDGVNLYAQMIDEAEGLEKIENL
ncbi:hypothetical protein MKW98_000009, partial [Papaver atlanticum]